jgi:hypothetical protein
MKQKTTPEAIRTINLTIAFFNVWETIKTTLFRICMLNELIMGRVSKERCCSSKGKNNTTTKVILK